MTGRTYCPMTTTALLLFSFIVQLLLVPTESLGLPNSIRSNLDEAAKPSATTKSEASFSNRRDILINLLRQSGMVIAATVTASVTADGRGNSAIAACLPGDISKDCIGVYKVPVDDGMLPYVGTPEALKTYAPDIRYVPPVAKPQSLDQALEILQNQRPVSQDIQSMVAAGRLEDAGLLVLKLLPQITVAGKLLVAAATNNGVPPYTSNMSASPSSSEMTIQQIRMMKLEQQLEMLLGLWGECDVMIGQGIRGDMGVSAVAQIQILSSLQDANRALDDFILSSLEATKARTK